MLLHKFVTPRVASDALRKISIVQKQSTLGALPVHRRVWNSKLLYNIPESNTRTQPPGTVPSALEALENEAYNEAPVTPPGIEVVQNATTTTPMFGPDGTTIIPIPIPNIVPPAIGVPIPGTSNVGSPSSLEIKDPAIIFQNVWNKLEAKYGVEYMRFPKEIIWLMGAPGAGKSVNAPYILQARGITAPELVMSSLLTSPEAEAIKKEAGLVGDSVVVEVLLEKLLQPEYAEGVLVDGFPRTKVQVECIKMLRDKMMQLRQQFMNTDVGPYFRRPVYRVAVLFIDEKGSVERQLFRGREAREHNIKVRDTGLGELKEERATDFSEELARRRYGVFKNHYSTLQELQKHLAFSVINTKAPLPQVQQSIMREFMYQSSLELAEETYDSVQKISLVGDITKHARQNLVRRLDTYQVRHPHLFAQVIEVLKTEFLPIMDRHAIAGSAQVRTNNPVFLQQTTPNPLSPTGASATPDIQDNDLAIQMALDVLYERGYYATSHPLVHFIPSKWDATTGEIQCQKVVSYVFSIQFKRSVIRQEV